MLAAAPRNCLEAARSSDPLNGEAKSSTAPSERHTFPILGRVDLLGEYDLPRSMLEALAD